MKMNERIRNLRIDRGMTQEELAKATGYSSRGAITLIEKGERDIPARKLSLFASALGVSKSFLVSGVDDKQANVTEPTKRSDFMVTTGDGKGCFVELVTTVAQMDQEQVKRVLEYAKLLEAAKNSK